MNLEKFLKMILRIFKTWKGENLKDSNFFTIQQGMGDVLQFSKIFN